MIDEEKTILGSLVLMTTKKIKINLKSKEEFEEIYSSKINNINTIEL